MPLSWNEIRGRATAFSREWSDGKDESSDAKSFWDAFFTVFGVPRRRVASFEQYVGKAKGKAGYIDLFWPGVMLAEHKSAGKDLARAFDQAVDYFPGIADKDLPRYIVVSDFQNFRITDMETGKESRFALKDLHKNITLFGFVAGYEVRDFKEQDPVNISAAQRLAGLHDALKSIGYVGHELEVYLVRLLFCLFAEDSGIFLPRGSFEDLIRTRTSEDGSDLASRLNDLYHVLNKPEDKRLSNLDEQLAAFPYVNGKLFEEHLSPASFDKKMRDSLLSCCELEWGQISPAIFGSLFQGIMSPKIRRNLGAHYTSEKNILKVIGPLFLDDLKTEFERVKNVPGRLKAFHDKLGTLQFFDPACGCGNFLVITYREIRLLELEVIRKLYAAENQQLALDVVEHLVKVDVNQFHGIEIEEWPAQIARVAMWLIDHQMNQRVGLAFGNALIRIPLVKSANILHGNALQIDWKTVIGTDLCNYVLGNPPFLGHHLQSAAQKADMLACYGNSTAAGVMDFVSAWYCKAADYIRGTSIKVAFVSTNSITQGEQVGIMWRALLEKAPLSIHFAHRTFKWSNEAKGVAAVYCVIIGFAAFEPQNCAIYEYEKPGAEAHRVPAATINAYLVDAAWVLLQNRTNNLFGMPEMKYGSKPTDDGNFLFTDAEKNAFLEKEPGAAKFIRPFISAHEYLHNEKRWTLWLVEADPGDLRDLPMVMARVEAVRAFRAKSKAKLTRSYPHHTLFRQVTQPKSDYILIPGHSSESRTYIPFGFLPKESIVGNSCFSLPTSSKYHYGLIQSTMHMAWVRFTCGRIKSDYRYSKEVVYNNFPWPLETTEKQQNTIVDVAEGILVARANYPRSTLSDLYDPLSMPSDLVKAHHALDVAVDAAYVKWGGKKTWSSDSERVVFLFALFERYTSLLPQPPALKQRVKKPKAA